MKSVYARSRWAAALLMSAVLVTLLAGRQVNAVRSNEPSEPVTSSTFAVAPLPAEASVQTPAVVLAPHGEFDQFLYLPAAFRPALLSSFAQQIVELTNQERARAGCGPLRVNVQLVQAAQGHSEDMAFNDFFSHTGSNGSSPWDRMEAAGYRWREAGENIAAGYTTPQAAMNGWMNSEGHRNNILRCSFEEIGVGYIYRQNDPGAVTYRHYWTQLFGRPQ